MTLVEYNKSVDEYADRLYRFILKNIQDTEEAKDIVQEAYARLWSKKDEVSAIKVKSYLFSTAYHVMIDMIRKEKRKNEYRQNMQQDPIHQDSYSDVSEILHEAIQKLPEIQRSVILLRDYEGYSYDEIAEVTGLNESQVKVYIFRGRMYLKKYIGKIETII
jgi:RNA polymerase sigma-70 factor (ECF subfamily)